jgi:hypothetical protein
MLSLAKPGIYGQARMGHRTKQVWVALGKKRSDSVDLEPGGRHLLAS